MRTSVLILATLAALGSSNPVAPSHRSIPHGTGIATRPHPTGRPHGTGSIPHGTGHPSKPTTLSTKKRPSNTPPRPTHPIQVRLVTAPAHPTTRRHPHHSSRSGTAPHPRPTFTRTRVARDVDDFSDDDFETLEEREAQFGPGGHPHGPPHGAPSGHPSFSRGPGGPHPSGPRPTGFPGGPRPSGGRPGGPRPSGGASAPVSAPAASSVVAEPSAAPEQSSAPEASAAPGDGEATE